MVSELNNTVSSHFSSPIFPFIVVVFIIHRLILLSIFSPKTILNKHNMLDLCSGQFSKMSVSGEREEGGPASKMSLSGEREEGDPDSNMSLSGEHDTKTKR